MTDGLIVGLLAGTNIGTDVLSEPRTLVQTRIATPSTGFRTFHYCYWLLSTKSRIIILIVSVKYQKPVLTRPGNPTVTALNTDQQLVQPP